MGGMQLPCTRRSICGDGIIDTFSLDTLPEDAKLPRGPVPRFAIASQRRRLSLPTLENAAESSEEAETPVTGPRKTSSEDVKLALIEPDSFDVLQDAGIETDTFGQSTTALTWK
jgi:hypothetical protein